MTWQTKLIALLLVIIGLFVWHKYEVNKAVVKTVQEQTLIYEKRVSDLTIKSLRVESELKDQISMITGDKNAQIKDIDRKYRIAIDSLRQRQERSTSSNSTTNSSNAESTKGTTGAGLYREDAEFLIRFSRDTQELKEQLKACYAQYDIVYDSLNNYRK